MNSHKESYVEEIAGHQRHSHHAGKKKLEEMKELIADDTERKVHSNFRRVKI
jgi:hypothetical protein